MKNDWRSKIGKIKMSGELDWRIYLHAEFVQFAEEAEQLSELYNWNFWGGGVNNYAVTVSQSGRDGISISIRLYSGDHYKYYVSFCREWNPNNIATSEYRECIGDTMDDALKYLHSFLIKNKYVPEINHERICIMGGAYDRYPLAKKWAYEELEKESLLP